MNTISSTRMKLSQPAATLHGVNRSTLNCVGTLDAKIKLGNKEHRKTLYFCKDLDDIYLSAVEAFADRTFRFSRPDFSLQIRCSHTTRTRLGFGRLPMPVAGTVFRSDLHHHRRRLTPKRQGMFLNFLLNCQRTVDSRSITIFSGYSKMRFPG